jgi:hypothetical protein
MKTLALFVAIAAVSVAQSGGASITGSWTAQFEGRTFLTLELTAVDGTITGGMRVGNIDVDKQGALSRVGESPRDLRPIFDVTQRASTVTFSRKDTDDSTPDRFELRLLEPGRAELHFLLSDADREELAASGIPALKPIPLTKQ